MAYPFPFPGEADQGAHDSAHGCAHIDPHGSSDATSHHGANPEPDSRVRGGDGTCHGRGLRQLEHDERDLQQLPAGGPGVLVFVGDLRQFLHLPYPNGQRHLPLGGYRVRPGLPAERALCGDALLL